MIISTPTDGQYWQQTDGFLCMLGKCIQEHSVLHWLKEYKHYYNNIHAFIKQSGWLFQFLSARGGKGPGYVTISEVGFFFLLVCNCGPTLRP